MYNATHALTNCVHYTHTLLVGLDKIEPLSHSQFRKLDCRCTFCHQDDYTYVTSKHFSSRSIWIMTDLILTSMKKALSLVPKLFPKIVNIDSS